MSEKKLPNHVELSPEERSALLAVLREIKNDEKPEGKRRHSRKAVSAWTRIKPVNGSTSNLLKGMLLRDVSPGGIGFTSFSRVDNGTVFVLEVEFVEGGTRAYRCEVTRSRVTADGMFNGGAKFIGVTEFHGRERD